MVSEITNVCYRSLWERDLETKRSVFVFLCISGFLTLGAIIHVLNFYLSGAHSSCWVSIKPNVDGCVKWWRAVKHQADTQILLPALPVAVYADGLTFSLPLVFRAVSAAHWLLFLDCSSLAFSLSLCPMCFSQNGTFMVSFWLQLCSFVKLSSRHLHTCTTSSSPCSTTETEAIQERCVLLQFVAFHLPLFVSFLVCFSFWLSL